MLYALDVPITGQRSADGDLHRGTVSGLGRSGRVFRCPGGGFDMSFRTCNDQLDRLID